jgi:hypothetical protein
VVPDPGADNHGPPEKVFADAVADGLPKSLEISNVWLAGGDPPIWYWKVSVAGEVDRFGRLVTASAIRTTSNESTVEEEISTTPA